MLEGDSVELATRRYAISPGDGVRYDFSIVRLAGAPNLSKVIRGVGDGEGYVGLILHNLRPSLMMEIEGDAPVPLDLLLHQVGSHEARISSLEDPIPPFISYLREKMGLDETYIYEIAAVVLAAGVLVSSPDALEEAADAMLRASSMIGAMRAGTLPKSSYEDPD